MKDYSRKHSSIKQSQENYPIPEIGTEGIPSKFLCTKTKQIRLHDLIKSYRHLERELKRMQGSMRLAKHPHNANRSNTLDFRKLDLLRQHEIGILGAQLTPELTEILAKLSPIPQKEFSWFDLYRWANNQTDKAKHDHEVSTHPAGPVPPYRQTIYSSAEDQARKLMRDPQYWRERNPVAVQSVAQRLRHMHGQDRYRRKDTSV